MKDNLTEIVFLLDQSGSMWDLRDDTIGGYNAFVSDQQKEPSDAYLTTILFDDHYIVLHDHIDIQNVPALTRNHYDPCGCTALLDAVGRAINDVGQRLANTPEAERPAHVIFVITTDGYENSSTHFTREQIKSMIEHQQNKYSWQFIFIGAGIDAFQEASSIGIDGAHSMSVSADRIGTQTLYSSVSTAASMARASGWLPDESWKTTQ